MIVSLKTLTVGSVASACLFATAFSENSSPPIPSGAVLIEPDASVFGPAIWVEDKSTAKFERVQVTGQHFPEALRLTCTKASPQPWQIGVATPTRGPIRKGDVLWITMEARSIESGKEASEAVADLVLMMKDSKGKEIRPLERCLTGGLDWTETSISFVAPQDAETGAAKLAIRFGSAAQKLEVGGVTLINCGPDADASKLPQAGGRYLGYATNAPWRAAAADRIEKIRKGDFRLKVVTADGKPVSGAQVTVRMKRHAFSFGAAVHAKHIASKDVPADVRYREIVETYFTKVTFANDLKWGRWIQHTPEARQRIAGALDWLDARKITARGHVLVWPSWQYTPPFLREMEKDPTALRKAVSEHIAEQTSAFGTRFADWDVINETYAHHDIVDILGREVMVDWFREARQGAPKARLFYNDYTMFHGNGPNSPSQHFYDTVQFLIDQKAPIGGIGEQGHFVGNPPGPADIIAALDRFEKLGLPVQITEFDITADDAQLKADFTRDFLTATFSHPAVDSVIHWEFYENPEGNPRASMWNKDGKILPNGQAFVDLISKTWWTNADGTTSADGIYQTRGFYGDYEVSLKHDGASRTVRLKLEPGAAVQTITLP